MRSRVSKILSKIYTLSPSFYYVITSFLHPLIPSSRRIH